VEDFAVDWDWLRAREQESSRSDDARAAARWALDVWRRHFGPRWPRGWRDPDRVPAELLAAWWSLRAFADFVDEALALELLADVPGIADVRAVVAGGVRHDQLASPRLQLRLGALAGAAGADVQLEAGPEASPRDLSLCHAGVQLEIEAVAPVRDAASVAATRWSDSVSHLLVGLTRDAGVDLEITIEAPPDEEGTARLLDEVEWAAGRVRSGDGAPLLVYGRTSVRVVRASGSGGHIRTRTPPTDQWERIGRRLVEKAEQSRRSGADWLVVDILSDLWRFTPWSSQPLPDKALELGDALRRALTGHPHIAGVLATNGAAISDLTAPSEDAEVGEGIVAMRRRLDRLRVRESVIVALNPRGDRGAQLLRELYESEPSFTAAGLEQRGLRRPAELEPAPP
jgi:hypothetical protein